VAVADPPLALVLWQVKAGPHSGGREIHGKDGSPVRFRRGLHT
jgi:hypothetical protein